MHYFFVFKVLDKYSLFIVARERTGLLIKGLIILPITGMNPKASFGNRFRSKLRSIKPSASRDNSTCKLQFTMFLKLGSHYNLPISTCDL